MKIVATVVAALAATSSVSGFTESSLRRRPLRQLQLLAHTPPAGFTDYLAKAHEEKLKAVKDAEAAKNKEIEALKKEIAELKSSSSSATASPALAQDDMAAKLLSYQKFVAKYIVEAQIEKVKAVKAAEEAVAKKYEAKLNLMAEGSIETKTEASPAAAAAVAVTSKESELFRLRNARVAAAAKAGKSRWGELENSRAAAAATVSASTPPAPTKASETAPKAIISKDSELFKLRNARVAAAAKAGKSRWGELENARAIEAASNTPPSGSVQTVTITPTSGTTNVGAEILRAAANGSSNGATYGAANGSAVSIDIPPEVIAADHGLRADGGVGGFTLAERIALGSNVLQAANGNAANGASTATSLYDKRNAKVTAAAKAGKSRWGAMEVEKAQSLASSSSSSSSSPPAATVPAEVVAADHGLRADGGVGGPTLAERVNLGASLLAAR